MALKKIDLRILSRPPSSANPSAAMAAAAIPLGLPLLGYPCRRPRRPTGARLALSCRGELQSSGTPDPKRNSAAGEKKGWRALFGVDAAAAEKAGRGLRESLSPKRKGDWKDAMLMSLSFAIYVYISQKLVCAYCAWMSMINSSRF